MYLIFSPAGANINYIGLKLCKIPTKKMFAYHDMGLHDLKKNIVIDVSDQPISKIKEFSKNQNIKFMTCINHKEEHYNLIKENNNSLLPLQIIVEKNQELLLINWQEKLRFNNNSLEITKKAIKEWEETQINSWQSYTKFTIERAVLHWTYKIFNKDYKEIKKIIGIKNFFNFSSFYESYENISNEFKKYQIKYSEQEYNDWKSSQEIIFNSWNAIKNNLDTPNKLKLDYQKGIAIALRGIKENINEQDCWFKYESLLN
jgi:hypothetical protein